MDWQEHEFQRQALPVRNLSPLTTVLGVNKSRPILQLIIFLRPALSLAVNKHQWQAVSSQFLLEAPVTCLYNRSMGHSLVNDNHVPGGLRFLSVLTCLSKPPVRMIVMTSKELWREKSYPYRWNWVQEKMEKLMCSSGKPVRDEMQFSSQALLISISSRNDCHFTTRNERLTTSHTFGLTARFWTWRWSELKHSLLTAAPETKN